MKRSIAALLLYLGLASAALAQSAVVVPATMFSVPINGATAATTRVAVGIANESIYVTQWNVMAGGTTTITFEYGTGTNCGTGTTALSGAYPLIAQVGLVVGTGYGAVLVVPPGQDLCIVNSAAIQVSGSLGYAIF